MPTIPTDLAPTDLAPTDPPAVITLVGTPPNTLPSDLPNNLESDDLPDSIVAPVVIPPAPTEIVLNPGIPNNIRPMVDQVIGNEIEAPEQVPPLPPVEFYTVNPTSSVENTTHFSRVERSFKKEFSSHLELAEPTIPDIGPEGARSLASEIEKATGERPGFIYVNFLPSDATQFLNLDQYEPQGTDELELTVITAGGGMVRRRVPGITRAQVVRIAQQFRRDITIPTRNATRHLSEAQQLYQWLVAPIQDQLEGYGITNLSFLAETGLRTIPFAALHDGTRYLAESYSVGMMPSLNLTNTEYVDVRDVSMLAMGVSESTDGQSPLPAVPTELSTLIFDVWKGELFLNEDATIDTLKGVRERTPFGIIHMATHAAFQDGPYDNSFIQLWNDRLNMDEIRELGWNDPPVEMLVLSACQTALGSREAELGFAGLAVQTGVKTAIASLWTVDDTATMSLMSQFYNMLNSAPIKSEALRQAQLSLLRGDVQVEEGVMYIAGFNRGITLPPESIPASAQDLAHPYYWSAFTIVGNPW